LEQLLGGTCHHMIEVFAHPDEIPVWYQAALGNMPDWQQFLAGYTAQVDWPGATFYKELADAFPDAIVLLSVRDPDDWYRSATNTIFNAIDPSKTDDPWQQMAVAGIGGHFCLEIDNPDAMKKAFVAHNDAVRDTIAKDRLVEWQPGDGWAPVATALGLPVPDGPVPLTNTTNEFRGMLGLPPV
ncbi:MAG TPA: sulfotransferase, partial [Acidimicrobiia bacterium]